MGTRHLILVYYRGTYHIAQYGQWDGDPSGQGVKVLSFVADSSRVAKLRSALEQPSLLYRPTDSQLKGWREEAQLAMQESQRRAHELQAKGEIPPWIDGIPASHICPSISRDTGARILDIVADATESDPVPIVKDIKFMTDKFSCEWVYLIDLDAQVLEVYSSRSGLEPLDTGRSRFRDEKKLKDAKYHPPLVGQFSIEKLPGEAEFLSALRQRDDEDADEGFKDGLGVR